ncbi:MAG: uroporphyrinogen decarboxylase family protein [Bacteroidota bacterium]
MTSRERVFKAIRREELPDRVPIQFDLSEPLIEAFSSKYGIPYKLNRSYYEDLTFRIGANSIRTKMGSDLVVVGGEAASGFKIVKDAEGAFVNEFGMKMRQGPVYMDVVDAPLKEIESVEEAEAYQFPDPHDPSRYLQAEEDIAEYKEAYFIVGDVEVTLFAMVRQLVGMEKLMIDMMMEADYLPVLIKKSKEFSLGVATELARRGVDAIWFGDDYGAQNNLLMSEETFRTFYKPAMAELIAGIKAVNPDIIIAQHCDGAVAPLLDDFIEVGVDLFNPVQPGVPGHDPQELKDRFGDRLSFWGALDQQYLLPMGTPEEIEADVKEKIEILGKGGGYIISPAHILQSDTSMENVEAFINAAKKYGKYGNS